jgi:hypothetical protein
MLNVLTNHVQCLHKQELLVGVPCEQLLEGHLHLVEGVLADEVL